MEFVQKHALGKILNRHDQIIVRYKESERITIVKPARLFFVSILAHVGDGDDGLAAVTRELLPLRKLCYNNDGGERGKVLITSSLHVNGLTFGPNQTNDGNTYL